MRLRGYADVLIVLKSFFFFVQILLIKFIPSSNHWRLGVIENPGGVIEGNT